MLTRSTDTGVGPCVDERAAIGTLAGSDAAISIHGDGGPAGASLGYQIPTTSGLFAPLGMLISEKPTPAARASIGASSRIAAAIRANIFMADSNVVGAHICPSM